jgi:protein SCO1/2
MKHLVLGGYAVVQRAACSVQRWERAITLHAVRCTLHVLSLALCIAVPAYAQRQPPVAGVTAQDKLLKEVRMDQKLNAQVPLDLVFQDETGRSRPLSDYFGTKPVMLILIQYRCTMLCSEEMNVLVESLKQMNFTPGVQFTLLVATIDPRETPELAAQKKQHYLEAYGRPRAAAGWHWLTAESPGAAMGAHGDGVIQRLANAVGFRYAYDAHTDQFAHPDGVILLTPEGKVARYFLRLEYPARDLRFGLMEAANRHIGSPLDKIALWCFHYNPVTGKYALAVMNLVRMGGLATLAFLIAGIVVMKSRERRLRAPGSGLWAGEAAPDVDSSPSAERRGTRTQRGSRER